MSETLAKTDTAFRTIGELAEDLGLPQHILRYWETRFPQLRPLQRAGKRRYYRPEDVALARRIHALLNEQGYTVKGVQKLLSGRATPAASVAAPAPVAPPPPPSFSGPRPTGTVIEALRRLRQELARTLAEDA
jgi:DNA-binding transcriptional MerR regulator